MFSLKIRLNLCLTTREYNVLLRCLLNLNAVSYKESIAPISLSL